jgi:type VI protein secretion system component VasF
MEGRRMTSLVELCEPIFVYVCYINRCGKADKEISYITTREEICGLLNSLKANLVHGSKLWRKFKRIELALLFFIDSMICDSCVSFAEEWDMKRLAYERGEMTGDLKFFQILNEISSEYSIDSEDCLTFFYFCLGLGFTGTFKNQPEEIIDRNNLIISRIPRLSESFKMEIFEDIYSNVDNRNILAKKWLSAKKIVFISLLLFIIIVLLNAFLYYLAVNPLFTTLNRVIEIIPQ